MMIDIMVTLAGCRVQSAWECCDDSVRACAGDRSYARAARYELLH
jgi:hypothetical protein